MTSASSSTEKTCPDCGAVIRPGASRCWLCGTPVDATKASPVEIPAPYERRAAFQFGLSTVLLLITAASVLLSISVMAPGLGIFLAILMTPAAIRTAVKAAKGQARGEPLSRGQKWRVFFVGFLISVGILILICLAAIVALLIICWSNPHGPF